MVPENRYGKNAAGGIPAARSVPIPAPFGRPAFGPAPSAGRRTQKASMRASVSSDRRAQDRFRAKPDEFVQTPVARLSGRTASRATNAYAVRAAEVVLTH
jgi:hypothetical protein